MALSSRMSAEIAVVGEIYLDHVFSGFTHWPEPGEEIFTENYTFELGGGALATACALARLGRRVQLIGVVGEAQFQTVAERLRQFGVGADLLLRSERGTGVTVSLSTTEDRSFFTYAGANRDIEEALLRNLEAPRAAAAARHVHMALPLTTHAGNIILPVLRRKGATLSLDVGHQKAWLTDARNRHTLQQVDYFLPNEREAEILAESAAGYFDFCSALGLRAAVIKLGAAGAVLRTEGQDYTAHTLPAAVVDTTGAGDAFNAGFIDGLLDGASPQACLERGCACGTLSTRAAGALGSLPDRAEMQVFLTELAKQNHCT